MAGEALRLLEAQRFLRGESGGVFGSTGDSMLVRGRFGDGGAKQRRMRLSGGVWLRRRLGADARCRIHQRCRAGAANRHRGGAVWPCVVKRAGNFSARLNSPAVQPGGLCSSEPAGSLGGGSVASKEVGVALAVCVPVRALSSTTLRGNVVVGANDVVGSSLLPTTIELAAQQLEVGREHERASIDEDLFELESSTSVANSQRSALPAAPQGGRRGRTAGARH